MAESTVTIIPYLTIKNCDAAIALYEKALGAKNHGATKDKQGRVVNAMLDIDGAMFYVMDEMPEHGAFGPAEAGSPVSIHLQVSNVDERFKQAEDAGFTVTMPLQDMFWGDRFGSFKDPFGHSWSMATTISHPSREEVQAAMDQMGM